MSATYEDLVTIKKVIDHDCGMYKIGEIDGCFQEHELREYLLNTTNGKENLLTHLSYLIYQVQDCHRNLPHEDGINKGEVK
jgi:hypothetical protein